MTDILVPRSTPVSVVIPTRNEARHIEPCVMSVLWANEIFVVDSSSTDGTPELATRVGAQVVDFRYQPGGLKKKNWALQNIAFNNEWILILDADERIPNDLAHEIASIATNGSSHAGFYINRRFVFLGRFIQHAGYYPSWNLRLLRRGRGWYEHYGDSNIHAGDNEIHEHLILDGTAGRLIHPMDHLAYSSIDEFIEKHLRYSSWEASVRTQYEAATALRDAGDSISRSLYRRRLLKRLARSLPCPHWSRFFYHYVLKLGFLDGVEGYILCHLLSQYEFWIWAKTRGSSASPTQE